MSFNENEYYDEVFKNIDTSEAILSDIEFDNCTFKNCQFHKTTLDSCRFIDCSFLECDLSLIKIEDSYFSDPIVKNSKAMGIDFSSLVSHTQLKFYDSNLSMSSFFQVDLKHSEFIRCNLNEVDFEQTGLEKVNFKESDLLNATFGNTNLKNADLSNAINYLINPEQNSLKGTKVSLPQADSFLKFLDVKIVS